MRPYAATTNAAMDFTEGTYEDFLLLAVFTTDIFFTNNFYSTAAKARAEGAYEEFFMDADEWGAKVTCHTFMSVC